MKGHDYEYVVADYLRRNGYSNVTVTKGSGDFGVDVLAYRHGSKYAIQCKYYSSPVGVSAIQEVVAGKAHYGCQKAMVISNNTFTLGAKTLARDNGVTLISYGNEIGRTFSLPNKIKLVLWSAYLFVASAILYATYDRVKTLPFLPATWESIRSLLLVTFPFWIRSAIKLIFRVIKAIINKLTEKPTDRLVPTETASIVKSASTDMDMKVKIVPPIDELFYQAVDAVMREQQTSISFIHQQLAIDYPRAARILSEMEDRGILGPILKNKPRDILITSTQWEEIKLQNQLKDME